MSAHRNPVRRGRLLGGRKQARVETPDGKVHVLNPSARAIWELCDGETTPAEMAAAVAAATGLDPQVALGQVEETLASFARLGLVDPG
ncbi:MAG: hypothetical protein KatS3mg011_0863 [Acidimicrobiia bacterium]|nr:MAG: hypothetical protein KatS3mg011_0863 [Acidimicrobiia bacterium]